MIPIRRKYLRAHNFATAKPHQMQGRVDHLEEDTQNRPKTGKKPARLPAQQTALAR